MKQRHPSLGVRVRTIFAIALSLLWLDWVSAFAQEVLAPPPPDFVPVLPYNPDLGQPQQEQTPTEELVAGARKGVEWAVRKLNPRALYRFSYADGLGFSGSGSHETLINELLLGTTIHFGDKWALDYSPTLRFYTSDKYKDNLEHSVRFSGGTMYNDWSFGFQQSYRSTSSPLIETGALTDREEYNTALSGVYRINSYLALDLGLRQDFRFVPNYIDSLEWSTMDWLMYRAAPTLSTGFGIGGGYADVSQGSDMSFELIQGRVSWAPGPKLSLAVNGGVDIRQFLDSNVPTAFNPIVGFSLGYAPRDHTRLSLSFNDQVSTSYYRDQLTEHTVIRAGLSQTLLEKLTLSLSGGYRVTSYSATSSGLNVTREDKGPTFDARVGTKFLKSGTVGVFYRWQENTSNNANFAFSNNQVGFELGYRF